MSSAASTSTTWTPFEKLRLATDIIRQESSALEQLANRIGPEFAEAVDTFLTCPGSVIVSGMGKAGLIGQKIAATLASTGTPSHFLHPAEAIHGDLGRVTDRDCLLLLSFSGETEEITRLLSPLQQLGTSLLAITAQATSTLGQAADLTLEFGKIPEACSLGLAPSTSTTMMLALGDALALVTSRCRGFQSIDFARFHPGGSLGRKLASVEDLMRPLSECRVAEDSLRVCDVLSQVNRPGRRTGAIMLVNDHQQLSGIFTDSDLARLLEQRNFDAIEQPIRDVMTADPLQVRIGTTMAKAIDLLADRKISELPVVDSELRPQGLVDITDVVRL